MPEIDGNLTRQPYPVGDSNRGQYIQTVDPLQVVSTPSASEGAELYSKLSVGTGDDAAVIKGSPGTVYSIAATNVNAAVSYLKLYNKASLPTTADIPAFRLAVPGATTGGGFIASFPQGLKFSNGIGIRLVTGAADNDGTDVVASEVMVNVGYA